jgi:hypothetical protein
MDSPGARKDPTIATLLSLCFPGAGYIYVGLPARFLFVFVAEVLLVCLLRDSPLGFLLAVFFHVASAISAAGAARIANQRLASDAPPPPGAGRTTPHRRAPSDDILPIPPLPPLPPPPPPPPPRSRAVPERAAPPAPAGPPLDADQFLAELRAAWMARRSGESTDAEFVARKLAAIERVRVADIDDGIALLESTAALVGAGVLTEAERTRLRLRVGRR